jgi:hypothetical protein
MIQVIQVDEDNRHVVNTAMVKLGCPDSSLGFGFWDGDRCVGGTTLNKVFMPTLNLEFYSSDYSMIKAISYAFSEFFKVTGSLVGKINKSNTKSLKIAKVLGFRLLYVKNGTCTVELIPENWRFKSKAPLTITRQSTKKEETYDN